MEPTALAGGKKHLGDYEAVPGVSLPAILNIGVVSVLMQIVPLCVAGKPAFCGSDHVHTITKRLIAREQRPLLLTALPLNSVDAVVMAMITACPMILVVGFIVWRCACALCLRGGACHSPACDQSALTSCRTSRSMANV